jgi:hypothetical protein|nr:MAG TPA: hypothetical protein [Caudoviricetes sp.]
MSITTAFYTGVARISKHAPTILSVTASAGVIATGYLAWKAGTRFEDVEGRDWDRRKECLRNADTIPDEDVPKIERKNRILFILDTVRTIAPAAIVGAATITMIYFSNSISKKRLAAMGAAYATLQTAFDGYKRTMVEALGEESVDKILKPKLPNVGKSAEEILSSDNKSDAANVSDAVVNSLKALSPYARIIAEESSTCWDPNEDYTSQNLAAVQLWANRRLERKGHLFLNEVFDQLGLSRTREGAVVGWLKNGEGDNYVSFGDFDASIYRVPSDDYTRVDSNFIVDFNVDGVIWDRI